MGLVVLCNHQWTSLNKTFLFPICITEEETDGTISYIEFESSSHVPCWQRFHEPVFEKGPKKIKNKNKNSKRRDGEKEESKNMGHQKGREYVFDLHGATLVFLWVHNNSVHLLDTFAH